MAATPQLARLTDDDGRGVDFDKSSHKQAFLGYAHHKNHDGRLFAAWDRDTLSIGGQVSLYFSVPNSASQVNSFGVAREIHLTWKASGLSGAGVVMAFEGTSVDVNSLGTAFTPHNHNHGAGISSVMSCYVNPLFQNTGTIADIGHFGSGNVTPGEDRGEAEHILPPGAHAVIILESAANTNPCLLKGTWYEHNRKE